MEFIVNIIDKIRNYKPSSQSMSLGASFLLLFILVIAGYIIFFMEMDCDLNSFRFPVMFLYILLFSFVLFFIFRRLKNENSYNLAFELTSHTFTFGTLILLIFSLFISFYIAYKIATSILLASIKFSAVFTIILSLIMLAMINSYTRMSDTDAPNIYISFIKDLIFYIPCLITDSIDYMKKDYKNTPSTVIILLFMLIILCFIYLGVYFIKSKGNLIVLVDKPEYLNKNVLMINNDKLVQLIIDKRPFYQKMLLNAQSNQNADITDISYSETCSKKIEVPLTYDEVTKDYVLSIEGFSSIISKETKPVHLTINEYDRYILKQAFYNNPSLKKKLDESDESDESKSNIKHTVIQEIIKKQKEIMSLYEKSLLYLGNLFTDDISKAILGDLYQNKYHYGLSFWFFLNSNTSNLGKDVIVKYGSRPSMYYLQESKELVVEIKDEIVIYRTSDILFQRWNHVVMNYNYGTFDLFINNNLVLTYPNVVSEISDDELLQVGSVSNNNLGGITQMYYYENPLQLNAIMNLYTNPPKF